MRTEGNPLDLNNLPVDEHGKQAMEESSTTTAASTGTAKSKKKKGGAKDENSKVYECRFCSLKFCKSQALGGHMNRHRQERETETLNRARQLVYSNEGFPAPGLHMGSFRDLNMGNSAAAAGGSSSGSAIGTDAYLQYRPLYPRLPTQSAPNAPPLHPYMYSSFPPTPTHRPPIGDYYIGHVLSGSSQPRLAPYDPSYACVDTHRGISPSVRPPTNDRLRDGI